MQTTFPINRPLHSGHTLPQKASGLNQPHTLAQRSTQPQFSGDNDHFLFKFLVVLGGCIGLSNLGTIAENSKIIADNTKASATLSALALPPETVGNLPRQLILPQPEAAQENQPQTVGNLPRQVILPQSPAAAR